MYPERELSPALFFALSSRNGPVFLEPAAQVMWEAAAHSINAKNRIQIEIKSVTKRVVRKLAFSSSDYIVVIRMQ
jgi:hypothetical protein